MSDKILKLDQAQTLYQDLRGRIDALPTSEDITVTDVQVNGTSVVADGVANLPVASASDLGLIKIGAGLRMAANGSNQILLQTANAGDIRNNNTTNAMTGHVSDACTFYGLAKAAGDTTQRGIVGVGTYTPSAKQAIQNMLGITDLLSTEETTTATAAHALNSLFLMGGKLYKATAAIAIGDAVVEGTNCQVVKADEVFPHDVQVNGTSVMANGVANVPIMSTTDFGVAKIGTPTATGIRVNSNGVIYVYPSVPDVVKAGTSDIRPIVPNVQDVSTFYGLSKVAGVDLANETVTLGTYPETSKTAIRSLIGAAAASDVTVSDVQVNGTSVLSNGIANIPLVTQYEQEGAVRINNRGLAFHTDPFDSTKTVLGIDIASDNSIKSSNSWWGVLVPAKQHASTFYGLAVAAGDTTQASSSNAVGTYTESAKASIRTMLGAASTNIVAVQDEQPTDTDTKVWLPETQAAGIQVPTMEDMNIALAGKVSDVQVNGTSIITNGVANVPLADNNVYGAARLSSDYNLKAGQYTTVVSTDRQHKSVFYGLAKAAGDSTQSASDNAIGTYTADASAAIRSMLGAVGDVQVNGTSVISNGTATVPIGGQDIYGVYKLGNTGTGLYLYNDYLTIAPASDFDAKIGVASFKPITPLNQHQSVFYGLAKAAGDTTQSASSNAVGTYTTEAKAAIHTMLGIDPASIAAQVEIPLVETVTGTTPSITGQPNTRYVCGEVSTLSITPPSAGSIDVIFDSGSTPAVITVPNTVRWPAWFDATALEADTTYEILITDGVYGSVMTWVN